ncbi:MAG: hypothetical protein AB7E72_13715, partial [Lysobacterales bacterium]
FHLACLNAAENPARHRLRTPTPPLPQLTFYVLRFTLLASALQKTRRGTASEPQPRRYPN